MLKSKGVTFTDPGKPSETKKISILKRSLCHFQKMRNLGAGDSVSFDWEANYVTDDYDVFGYLLDKNTGQVITT
ncbi:MAG: hypothetical protein CM15mP80_02740 [Alphaproteobacteria bacterium]|nr:MAG: hypothetical protein CM15mP80_02740 [Alphaproteobacteria bacterium]